ncbi:MAG: hypothetical protein JNK89_10085, partial [Saprospiraceae bacterium]|nr:hypothetical protein [Saprospiraceae bacterium]
KQHKILKRQSFDRIEQLKDQVLLVRLNTAQNSISALQKANKIEQAEYVRRKVQEENETLISGFRKHFTFTKIYFFYSDDAERLRNHQFDQVKLFDAEKQPLDNPAILQNGYLVAAVGMVYHDQYVQQSQGVRHAVAGTNGMPALVLMDTDYVNLRKPFPYRVILDANKGVEEISVRNLDHQLYKYFSRSQRKKWRSG